MAQASTSTTIDSPSFTRSFERWRIAITSLATPNSALLCEDSSPGPSTSTSISTSSTTPTWSDGEIMQSKNTSSDTVNDEKERKRLIKECKRCEKWRDELTRESPIIRFMLQHISLLPPPPTSSDSSPSSSSSTPHLPLPITCQPCPPTLAGGYSSSLGILLCQNRFMSKGHMQDALAHELVHAYDDRRFESKDGKSAWGQDLKSHACTEIRAENLSGDCKFSREFTRRNWTFTKQHQACVRRRAILSVAANPNCKSKEQAEQVVNQVWESCWPDTRPFDEIY